MNKEITDPAQIKKIVETLFKVSTVYMDVIGESIPVKFIDYKPEGILIRTSKTNSDSSEKILTVTNKDNIFTFDCTETGSDDFGNLILNVSKVSINDIASLSTSDVQFEVTSIISPTEIFKALNDDRVVQLIKRAPKVSYMFDFFEVYISERPTSRMRLMSAHDRPIFVPNILSPDSVKPDFVPYPEYIAMTKNSTVLDKYKAEICIPIKYKNYILIGYAHAMHSTRLDLNSYNTFRLVASSVIRDVHTSGIFDETKEKCPVIEFAKDYIRFLHPPTRQSNRLFSVGAQIIFDLIARGGNKKFVRGTVKAIKPTQKDYSITCEFGTMSKEEQESIQDFIATHSM